MALKSVISALFTKGSIMSTPSIESVSITTPLGTFSGTTLAKAKSAARKAQEKHDIAQAEIAARHRVARGEAAVIAARIMADYINGNESPVYSEWVIRPDSGDFSRYVAPLAYGGWRIRVNEYGDGAVVLLHSSDYVVDAIAIGVDGNVKAVWYRYGDGEQEAFAVAAEGLEVAMSNLPPAITLAWFTQSERKAVENV